MIWDYITNWDLFENAVVVQHKEQMNTITMLIEQRGEKHIIIFIRCLKGIPLNSATIHFFKNIKLNRNLCILPYVKPSVSQPTYFSIGVTDFPH